MKHNVFECLVSFLFSSLMLQLHFKPSPLMLRLNIDLKNITTSLTIFFNMMVNDSICRQEDTRSNYMLVYLAFCNQLSLCYWQSWWDYLTVLWVRPWGVIAEIPDVSPSFWKYLNSSGELPKTFQMIDPTYGVFFKHKCLIFLTDMSEGNCSPRHMFHTCLMPFTPTRPI